MDEFMKLSIKADLVRQLLLASAGELVPLPGDNVASSEAVVNHFFQIADDFIRIGQERGEIHTVTKGRS